ncbi:MAG: DUF4412 domain-containing protein [bacterium]
MTLKTSVFVVMLLLVLPLAASADYKLVQAVHVDGYSMQGQTVPAKDDTTVTWLAPGQARVNQGDTASFVIVAEKNLMYMLDHKDKKYTEVPVGAFASMIEAQGDKDSTTMAQAKSMLDMMRVKAKVTPTEEAQKIGDWDCKKYELAIEIAMTTSTTEAWVTKDIDLDYELYSWATQTMKAFLPGFDEALAEMKKMEGVQVKSITTASFMGVDMKTTTELISVEQASAPAGSFGIPEGYAKTDLQMPGM